MIYDWYRNSAWRKRKPSFEQQRGKNQPRKHTGIGAASRSPAPLQPAPPRPSCRRTLQSNAEHAIDDRRPLRTTPQWATNWPKCVRRKRWSRRPLRLPARVFDHRSKKCGPGQAGADTFCLKRNPARNRISPSMSRPRLIHSPLARSRMAAAAMPAAESVNRRLRSFLRQFAPACRSLRRTWMAAAGAFAAVRWPGKEPRRRPRTCRGARAQSAATSR